MSHHNLARDIPACGKVVWGFIRQFRCHLVLASIAVKTLCVVLAALGLQIALNLPTIEPTHTYPLQATRLIPRGLRGLREIRAQCARLSSPSTFYSDSPLISPLACMRTSLNCKSSVSGSKGFDRSQPARLYSLHAYPSRHPHPIHPVTAQPASDSSSGGQNPPPQKDVNQVGSHADPSQQDSEADTKTISDSKPEVGKKDSVSSDENSKDSLSGVGPPLLDDGSWIIMRVQSPWDTSLADAQDLLQEYADELKLQPDLQGFEKQIQGEIDQELEELPGPYSPPAGIMLIIRQVISEPERDLKPHPFVVYPDPGPREVPILNSEIEDAEIGEGDVVQEDVVGGGAEREDLSESKDTDSNRIAGEEEGEDGGVPVNSVAVGLAAMRKGGNDWCELQRLYIRPENRGRGLGRMLVQRLLEDSRKIGRYRVIRLDSASHLQASTALVRSFGFYPIEPYRSQQVSKYKSSNSVHLELDLNSIPRRKKPSVRKKSREGTDNGENTQNGESRKSSENVESRGSSDSAN